MTPNIFIVCKPVSYVCVLKLHQQIKKFRVSTTSSSLLYFLYSVGPVVCIRLSKWGAVKFFKAWATLKYTKHIAGRIEGLVHNYVNTIISLTINLMQCLLECAMYTNGGMRKVFKVNAAVKKELKIVFWVLFALRWTKNLNKFANTETDIKLIQF
jgi:hypothetical protein